MDRKELAELKVRDVLEVSDETEKRVLCILAISDESDRIAMIIFRLDGEKKEWLDDYAVSFSVRSISGLLRTEESIKKVDPTTYFEEHPRGLGATCHLFNDFLSKFAAFLPGPMSDEGLKGLRVYPGERRTEDTDKD